MWASPSVQEILSPVLEKGLNRAPMSTNGPSICMLMPEHKEHHSPPSLDLFLVLPLLFPL